MSNQQPSNARNFPTSCVAKQSDTYKQCRGIPRIVQILRVRTDPEKCSLRIQILIRFDESIDLCLSLLMRYWKTAIGDFFGVGEGAENVVFQGWGFRCCIGEILALFYFEGDCDIWR